jgi:hypothetical protein
MNGVEALFMLKSDPHETEIAWLQLSVVYRFLSVIS